MNFSSIFRKRDLPKAVTDYNYFFETSNHDGVTLTSLELGILNVPTGSVVVSDPLVCLGATEPLLKRINPDRYPVSVRIANTPDMGDRYAFVKLKISNNKAVKYELAITKSEQKKIHELKDGEYIGFPVDAGLGSFCDEVTQEQYKTFVNDFYQENPKLNIYDDFFAEEFKKNAKNQKDPNDIGDWLNFTIPNTKNNVIMFHSGFGDGLYPSYWG